MSTDADHQALIRIVWFRFFLNAIEYGTSDKIINCTERKNYKDPR